MREKLFMILMFIGCLMVYGQSSSISPKPDGKGWVYDHCINDWYKYVEDCGTCLKPNGIWHANSDETTQCIERRVDAKSGLK